MSRWNDPLPKTERGWFLRKALSGKKTLLDCPHFLDDCDMDWIVCYFDLLLQRRADIAGHKKAKKMIAEMRSSPEEVRAEQKKSKEIVLGMAQLKDADISALKAYAMALSASDDVATKWKIAA